MKFTQHGLRLLLCIISCWAGVFLCISVTGQTYDPAALDTYLIRGSEQYAKGQFDECVATMREFLDQYGNDPLTPRSLKRIYYLLTLALVRLEHWDEVITSAEKYRSDPGDDDKARNADIVFWGAYALDRLERSEDAHRAYLAFAAQFPTDPKVDLATTLAGSVLIRAGKFAEAADYYATHRKQLTGFAAGEALLLELSCRLNINQTTSLLPIIKEAWQTPESLPRPATLALITLKLADSFQSQNQPRQAIATLWQLRDFQTILELQRQASRQLAERYEILARQDVASPQAKLAASELRSAKKSLRTLEQMPNFDSTVRYHLAVAFLSMKRYREAAQVLASMLDELPPDPVVERASDAVVRSYFETKQWEKVIVTVDTFSRKFPASDALAGVLILKGQALQELEDYDKADAVFDEVLARFPSHELAPHALIGKGFSDIWREDYPSAQRKFLEVRERFSEADSKDIATFWAAQSLSLQKLWPETIIAMKAYLDEFPNGQSLSEARFRILFAEHALRNYETSIPLARDFIQSFPDDPNRPEAHLILGDGLLAKGDIEEGLAALAATPKGSGSFREEATFRILKVYRLMQDDEAMRKTLRAYQAEFPGSPRLAESVYWEGWIERKDPARQAAIYRDAIRKYGADVAQWGVADMIRDSIKISSDRSALHAFFESLADSSQPRPLRLNGLWALSLLNSEQRDQHLAGALPLVQPSEDNPLILLDIAESLEKSGQTDDAVALLKDIRRWNPQHPANDRVFASLGFIELERGNILAADKAFTRYLQETAATASRGKVLVRSADALLALGRNEEAAIRYEEALKEKSTPRRLKAEALLGMGNLHMISQQPGKAAAYFQRIFVLYSAYSDLAAQAYLRCAQAMAQVEGPVEEARVLLELIARDDLGEAADQARNTARKRLDALPIAAVDAAKEKNAATQLAEAEALSQALSSP